VELISGRMLDLLVLATIWGIMLYMIYSKRDVWIRRIAAVDFIEEAAGRAAEMGRPIIVQGFGSSTSGLQSAIAPMIMACLAVLGHVARICARHGTVLIAPMRSESVIPVADEVIKTAYRLEGKLEEYEANKEEMLPWMPTQASLVALGMRVKPAANIMLGAFWHESVMVAEAYARLGAVQIGGSGRTTQIPFFAAICDMNLIGEEIYAVSTYLNPVPHMLGSMATQDILKLLAIFTIIIGTLLATLGGNLVNPLVALLEW